MIDKLLIQLSLMHFFKITKYSSTKTFKFEDFQKQISTIYFEMHFFVAKVSLNLGLQELTKTYISSIINLINYPLPLKTHGKTKV